MLLQEASVFAGLIARRMPALSEHMEELCVHPLMYVTQWYVNFAGGVQRSRKPVNRAVLVLAQLTLDAQCPSQGLCVVTRPCRSGMLS